MSSHGNLVLRREYARRLRMQVLFSPIPDPRDGPLMFNKANGISTVTCPGSLQRWGCAREPWGQARCGSH